MPSRSVVRRGFALLAAALVLLLVVSYVTAGAYPNDRYESQASKSGPGAQVVEPRDGITVVTTQFGKQRGVSGELIAVRPNGTVLYHTDRYNSYWDVDPSPAGSETVLYVATQNLPKSYCSGLGGASYCKLNVVERLNLSTGERTRLYAHRADHDDNRWHDVDRIDEDTLLVGGIGEDTVFTVNTTTGIRNWTWTAESYYPRSGGGNFHDDWTHINDVSYLHDGRIMVDVRNQDQVAFLNRTGVQPGWTLGAEDAHSILNEQHNPDYIPASRGGPAVIVADSENNRVVEYQRRNGEWEQSWVWSDARMQWPRDADRLPNGNTLVTDTIGDRVLEVNPDGEVVWTMHVDRPYEAERLGTGDESSGGQSAAALDLRSRNPNDTLTGKQGSVEHGIRSVVPMKVQNGLLGYFFPWWVRFWDLVAVFALAGVAIAWAGTELWWLRERVDVRAPVTYRGDPSWRASALVCVGVAAALYAVSFVLQFF